MQATAQTPPLSTRTHWVGHVISGLPLLFMVMDSILKLVNPPVVVETMAALGYPAHLAPPIGIVALICVVLTVIPRTAVLGAILLTGYLGGAIATHVRVGPDLASTGFSIILPVVLGVMVWGGLYLRDARLRALIPLRN